MAVRTTGGRALHLTYGGWNLLEERDGAGDLQQVYVHGARIDEMLAKITPAGSAYYLCDALGSTVALTGATGEVLESYLYDAFGAAQIFDSSFSTVPSTLQNNRFLFTGREWLAEAGLYDYRNRVYSPAHGRFLQTDPIRFAAGDANIYRYVGNNPVNLWDPWGLDAHLVIHRDGGRGSAGTMHVFENGRYLGTTRVNENGYDRKADGTFSEHRVQRINLSKPSVRIKSTGLWKISGSDYVLIYEKSDNQAWKAPPSWQMSAKMISVTQNRFEYLHREGLKITETRANKPLDSFTWAVLSQGLTD